MGMDFVRFGDITLESWDKTWFETAFVLSTRSQPLSAFQDEYSLWLVLVSIIRVLFICRSASHFFSILCSFCSCLCHIESENQNISTSKHHHWHLPLVPSNAKVLTILPHVYLSFTQEYLPQRTPSPQRQHHQHQRQAQQQWRRVCLILCHATATAIAVKHTATQSASRKWTGRSTFYAFSLFFGLVYILISLYYGMCCEIVEPSLNRVVFIADIPSFPKAFCCIHQL